MRRGGVGLKGGGGERRLLFVLERKGKVSAGVVGEENADLQLHGTKTSLCSIKTSVRREGRETGNGAMAGWLA